MRSDRPLCKTCKTLGRLDGFSMIQLYLLEEIPCTFESRHLFSHFSPVTSLPQSHPCTPQQAPIHHIFYKSNMSNLSHPSGRWVPHPPYFQCGLPVSSISPSLPQSPPGRPRRTGAPSGRSSRSRRRRCRSDTSHRRRPRTDGRPEQIGLRRGQSKRRVGPGGSDLPPQKRGGGGFGPFRGHLENRSGELAHRGCNFLCSSTCSEHVHGCVEFSQISRNGMVKMDRCSRQEPFAHPMVFRRVLNYPGVWGSTPGHVVRSVCRSFTHNV